MGYTNSPLVTYTRISKNKTSPRNHKIDTITIHCVVGQWTAKQGCDYFATSAKNASCNYFVGKDGSIGLCVEEKDRSWCSSSRSNDNRAVTIEGASDTADPYKVTDAALNALIKLVADICKRNGIKKLLWKNDKSLIGQVDKQNMTVHRWFANKACPGNYLMSKHPEIAKRVNEILGASTTTITASSEHGNSVASYRVQTGAFSSKVNADKEAARVKAAGFEALVVQSNGLYKVQVGVFVNQNNAKTLVTKLKAAGFTAVIVESNGTVVSQPTKSVTAGATVRVKKGAPSYNGKSLASFVYSRDHRVDSVNGDRAVISYNGTVVAAINIKDLIVV